VTDDEEELPREWLQEWTVPEMPTDIKERVMAQVHEQWNMGVPTHAYGAQPKRSAATLAALLTAGVALAAAGTAVFLSMRPEAPAMNEPPKPAPMAVAAEAPRVPRGHLTIAVMPADATVEIDGVALVGPSPFIATDLTVGAHQLRVAREGHVAWSRVVDVPDGQLHLPIMLAPATAAAEIVDEEVPLETNVAEGKVPDELLRELLTTKLGYRSPKVRQAKADVKGTMDKDIIRRIVRANINDVRLCYNQGLVKNPALKGRVSIQFTIAPSGKVAVSIVQESTLSDAAVGQCIAKAVKRWSFPPPEGGGNVVVEYPFILESG
jgi:TonB family protein